MKPYGWYRIPCTCRECWNVRKRPVSKGTARQAGRKEAKADDALDAFDATSLVLDFFKGDRDKTRLWFETPNPMLGGMAPNDMIALGRAAKLLKFVRTALEENER